MISVECRMSPLTLEWPTVQCFLSFKWVILQGNVYFAFMQQQMHMACIKHLQHDLNNEHFSFDTVVLFFTDNMLHTAVLQYGVIMWSEHSVHSEAVSGVGRTSHHQLTAACCPLHGYTRSARLTLTASEDRACSILEHPVWWLPNMPSMCKYLDTKCSSKL